MVDIRKINLNCKLLLLFRSIKSNRGVRPVNCNDIGIAEYTGITRMGNVTVTELVKAPRVVTLALVLRDRSKSKNV